MVNSSGFRAFVKSTNFKVDWAGSLNFQKNHHAEEGTAQGAVWPQATGSTNENGPLTFGYSQWSNVLFFFRFCGEEGRKKGEKTAASQVAKRTANPLSPTIHKVVC